MESVDGIVFIADDVDVKKSVKKTPSSSFIALIKSGTSISNVLLILS